MKIGIYALFINKYIIYLDNFLKNINMNCLTKYKKKFFLVTNKENENIIKNFQEKYEINYIKI